MFKQGASLGRQLGAFVPALVELCRKADAEGRRVWFLGRDCDVFAEALRRAGFAAARYLSGLNRENAAHLGRRRRLGRWLRRTGVGTGDILIDSGYKGSIFDAIKSSSEEEGDDLQLELVLLTSSGVYPSVDPGLSRRYRPAVLALEHSPKREEVSWDADHRIPSVRFVDDRRAFEFFEGCVEALRRGIEM
jgi:hypothetical protein